MISERNTMETPERTGGRQRWSCESHGGDAAVLPLIDRTNNGKRRVLKDASRRSTNDRCWFNLNHHFNPTH